MRKKRYCLLLSVSVLGYDRILFDKNLSYIDYDLILPFLMNLRKENERVPFEKEWCYIIQDGNVAAFKQFWDESIDVLYVPNMFQYEIAFYEYVKSGQKREFYDQPPPWTNWE